MLFSIILAAVPPQSSSDITTASSCKDPLASVPRENCISYYVAIVMGSLNWPQLHLCLLFISQANSSSDQANSDGRPSDQNSKPSEIQTHCIYDARRIMGRDSKFYFASCQMWCSCRAGSQDRENAESWCLVTIKPSGPREFCT
jgi:hypothetical protein